MIHITYENGKTLFQCAADTVREALILAAATRVNLKHAHLEEAYLYKATLDRIQLPGACLEAAVLEDASFIYANLKNTDFCGANLRNADFTCAHLYGASFRNADLTNVNFQFANLTNIDWHCAILNGTNYGPGIPMTKPPAQITGFRWNILIFDKHIKIGCQIHPTKSWAKFHDGTINSMSIYALDFWRKHKDMIFAAAALHQQNI